MCTRVKQVEGEGERVKGNKEFKIGAQNFSLRVLPSIPETCRADW